MRHTRHWIGALLALAVVPLSACRKGADASAAKIAPAHVEHIDGTELSRVTLTAKAAERLGIQTTTVRDLSGARSGSVQPVGMTGSQRRVVPYAAVLYDAHGATWVYTSPEPLVFVRHRITVEYIQGDDAVLSDGPRVGTPVVTVGGAELFGAEFEIGH